MTKDELAMSVEHIVAKAQSRIRMSTEYSLRDEQGRPIEKFESMDLDALLTYMEEECLDHINYGVMMSLRVQRLRLALSAARGK